ncbi:MAG TPA: FGGY family carbohydrate kinase, partial [Bacteroidales bacterium]|nr:FGGY family carbohydrate kinase [Bacteroidales bacterium]
MKKDLVIVFDCGATNLRVIAIDGHGKIIASESAPNCTKPDPFNPAWRIWDVNDIWKQMCLASRKVTAGIDKSKILGATVTTFGVDGTLFDRTGQMLYPVISWQCERTVAIMADIGKYIPLTDLYSESGVLPFTFNTINKLIWFAENKPELIEKSHRFMFMPSIFSYFLTGEMINDTTMAGTSMASSLATRSMSGVILGKINFPAGRFGDIAEPGTITGVVTPGASAETGLPAGVPVVATGHDTQFAIYGSGAEIN